jgi:hypothetical protein
MEPTATELGLGEQEQRAHFWGWGLEALLVEKAQLLAEFPLRELEQAAAEMGEMVEGQTIKGAEAVVELTEAVVVVAAEGGISMAAEQRENPAKAAQPTRACVQEALVNLFLGRWTFLPWRGQQLIFQFQAA